MAEVSGSMAFLRSFRLIVTISTPSFNSVSTFLFSIFPELIVVPGVSGQVQHIGGINKSKVLVAINKDKAAPVFKNADFGQAGRQPEIGRAHV